MCIHAPSEWELDPSKISREKRSWSCKTSFLNMTGAKNLNPRHLRYARRFKSTNQCMWPNKHPCAGQGCGFELPTVAVVCSWRSCSTRNQDFPISASAAIVQWRYKGDEQTKAQGGEEMAPHRSGGRSTSVQGSQKPVKQPDECCTEGVLQRPHWRQQWRPEETFLGNE